MPLAFTQDQLALINILLRLVVMAGITSLVLGFRFTGEILVKVSVPTREKVKLTVLLAVIFSVGVLIRKMSAQAAMDLSLEGAIVAGLIGGTWVGAGTGFAIGFLRYITSSSISSAALSTETSSPWCCASVSRSCGTRYSGGSGRRGLYTDIP
jgi:LytS/YehU family sensor histidine kinase